MSRPTLVLAAAFALVASGCLAAFPNDPTGSGSPASGAAGSGGSGGGNIGGNGTGGNGGTGGNSGTGGSGGGGGTMTGGADAGVGQDGGVTGSGADLGNVAPADMANNCIKLTTPVQDGHHNAGDACLNCHDGAGATLFTWGGTLCNAATNGAIISGATIEVIDASGKVDRIVSSSNGNFYSSASLTPPFTVRASGCPNNTAMVGKATGNCNSSGCHASTMRVHLP